MRARHGFLFVCAAGCWLGLASGCSPEYELLGSAEPSAGIGGSLANGGSLAIGGMLPIDVGGHPTAATNEGGAEALPDGGESAMGGFDVGGSAGFF